MGRIFIYEKKYQRYINLKDGIMLMGVENGLIWLEIHLMMKLN